MVSPSKVGEVFALAGAAFDLFGSLTKQLRPNDDSATGNLNEEEVDMLKETIKTFAENLLEISERMKIHSISAVRERLRKNAFEDAGLPVSNEKSGFPENFPYMIMNLPEPESDLEELEDIINYTCE